LLECISHLERNCPFWTCFSKLSTEDMLVSVSVDAASYFSLPISQLCRNKSFLRKAVLPRHAKRVSDSIGAASALLASASAPSSIQHGLGQYSVWASFWCSACARAPGYCFRSVQARRLNSAATRASGVLGGINHRQWSVRSIALACPCRSLEGLLFATQKTCLRKS
jgi:hypothetical protein